MNWLDKKLQKANYKRLDEIRKKVVEEERLRQLQNPTAPITGAVNKKK